MFSPRREDSVTSSPSSLRRVKSGACEPTSAGTSAGYPMGLVIIVLQSSNADSMTAKIPVQTLILAHPNVDFDAFAAMLAAQLLYPGARICLHGGANRNVREFFNLHADEIPSVEASAVDPDAVRRLVLVENTDSRRLGPLAGIAERADVEVIAF